MRTETIQCRSKGGFHFFWKVQVESNWNMRKNHHLVIQNREFNTKHILQFPERNCASSFWQQLNIELDSYIDGITQSEVEDCLIDTARKFEGAFMLHQLSSVL